MAYYNNFSSDADIIREFSISEADMEGVNVIIASYGNEDYEGDAFVLFTKNGKLYEVNGCHCSCHGLENQWAPEETDLRALSMRFNSKSGYVSSSHGKDFAKNVVRIVTDELFEREVLQ